MIHVHRLQSLIGPIERTDIELDLAGITAAELVELTRDPSWTEAAAVAVIIDGAPAIRGAELERVIVNDEADVVVVPDPGGPVIVVLAFLGGLLLEALVAGAIAFAINLAYQAIVGKPKAGQARGGGEESQTYNWTGIATNYGSGFPIPIAYGIHRVGGQIISTNIYDEGIDRDILALLIAIGEGPISQIGGLDLEKFPELNDLGGLFRSRNPLLPAGIKVNGATLTTADARFFTRNGTQVQSPISAWILAHTTFPQNVPLRSGKTHEYTTSGTTVGRLRIRIRFDALFKQSGNNRVAHTVQITSRFRETGSTLNFSQVQTATITAQKGSPFNWSFEMFFPKNAEWDIQIRRVTPDDKQDTVSSSTWVAIVESFQPGIDQVLAYPNMALLSLEMLATERLAGTQPNVTVPIRGRLVRHWTAASGFEGPHFLELATSTWWGRDPAWILHDYLTNARYGLGNWLTDDDLDLPSFELWSKYGQVKVDDGAAGTHERYFFDGVLDSREAAWEIIMRICRVGNAVPVIDGNKIRIKFEHDDDPAGGFPRPRNQVFTQANMTAFSLTFSDQSQRPNIIDLQILNVDLDYEQDLISVEDESAFGLNDPEKLGADVIRRQVVNLFGCVRPEHARRIGDFINQTNRRMNQVVRFTCAIDGLAAEVGDRIGVETDVARFFDSETEGIRSTVAGAASNTMFVDVEIVLAPATTYEFAIVATDGIVVVRTITAVAATYAPNTAITFGGAAVTWPKGTVVGWGIAGAVLVDFLITEITMTEELQREITARNFDPLVYTPQANLSLGEGTDFTGGEIIGAVDILAPIGPTSVFVDDDGDTLIGWLIPQDQRGTPSRVYVRPVIDPLTETDIGDFATRINWELVWEGIGDEARIHGLAPFLTYEFAVVTRNADGSWLGPDGVPLETLVIPEFPRSIPFQPEFESSAERESGIELRWKPIRSDAIAYYEVRRGDSWHGAEMRARVDSDRVWLKDAPFGSQKYEVRSRHRNGLYSGAENLVTVSVGVPAGTTFGETFTW